MRIQRLTNNLSSIYVINTIKGVTGVPCLICLFFGKFLSGLIWSQHCTVGTPNKGQPIFSENGSNKGILRIPFIAIFGKSSQIKEFPMQISLEMHFLMKFDHI